MPLKRIARIAGFRDEQALRRAFIQQMSVTPKEYRLVFRRESVEPIGSYGLDAVTRGSRAEGLPSRTAIGLVYVEKGRQPYLGFHMWTEVLVEGQWLGLDATLGQGGVGVGHVKISDHSWHGVQSQTPLLPLARVLGKVAVEVVRVEAE